MQSPAEKHVKTYRGPNGTTYHYHRITTERLPDDPAERAIRVREINESPREALLGVRAEWARARDTGGAKSSV